MGTEDKPSNPSSESDVSNILSVNLPQEMVFQQLMNYFKPKYGRKYYFTTEKVSTSHIEGKWEFGYLPSLCLPIGGGVYSGYFKIDITSNDGKSQVKLNFSSPLNMHALGCFIVGLLLWLLLRPLWPIWLFLFCSAIALFLLGQWRTSDVLQEMNQFFSNIPETVEE